MMQAISLTSMSINQLSSQDSDQVLIPVDYFNEELLPPSSVNFGLSSENSLEELDYPDSKITKISEIILAGKNPHADLTLAMLAHLSHAYKFGAEKNRWLTWICPMHISKQALTHFNFDLLGLRILHPKTEAQIPQLMHHALNAGTSHTVVAHCQKISSKLFPWLEIAACKGDSTGLFIRPQHL
jgi:cell division inhibitor SulA